MSATMSDALATLSNVTENERKFLQALVEGLYAEPGFSDVTVDDVAARMGTSVKSAKGTLGALVKKGFVWTDRADTDAGDFHLIYLHEKHYDLHGKWFAEVTEVATEVAAAEALADPGMVVADGFAQAIIDGDHGAAVEALATAGIPDASVPTVELGEYTYKIAPLDYVASEGGVEVSAGEPMPVGTGAVKAITIEVDVDCGDIPPGVVAERIAETASAHVGGVEVVGARVAGPSMTGGHVLMNTIPGADPSKRADALLALALVRPLTTEEVDFLRGHILPASKKAPKSANPPGTAKPRDPRLPPAGTVIERVFRGQTYAVETTDTNAVLGRGVLTAHAFASLSGAAKFITGNETSGFAFWLRTPK